jgi:hypothetical protein
MRNSRDGDKAQLPENLREGELRSENRRKLVTEELVNETTQSEDAKIVLLVSLASLK